MDTYMRRVGFLFEQVCSFQNLNRAFKKAMRAANNKPVALEFFYNLEQELFSLQTELMDGSYQPAAYRYFTIYDPKERTIAVAPFRDRVAHHAIINILEPLYEKIFIFDSYATRKGKGTHLAIARAQTHLKQNRWFLKSDIEKYFESMHHGILMSIINRKLKDKKLLELLDKIISNGGHNGVGLPIGNLTSQFFANVYLDPFDHFIKDRLGIRYYLRYMDDFVFFDHDKTVLKNYFKEGRSFLEDQLGLKIKESATLLNNRTHGLSFLGRRIFPAYVKLKNENKKRGLSKLKIRQSEYERGLISEESFISSLNSLHSYLSVRF
ncbi:MAG: group II intron reverse transcriptase domain-containing protein [Calditrichaceae bacterium]|nr:group II intron reverse transcriptase domain-containing protein [Calditrichaceae bacterium]